MWSFLVLALFLALPLGGQAQIKLNMNDKSEAELVALMNDMVKLLNVRKQVPLGSIDKEVKFICSNRTGPYQQVLLNDVNLFRKLDLKKPVAFVTHGWTSNFTAPQFQALARNYTRFVDSNFCLVDWAQLAMYPYDIAAQQSLMMVVNYFSRFLRFLNLNGLPYSKVTLIGHSLGGQISGFVGKSLNGAVGQIFALDPAGVLFTLPQDVGVQKRLAPTDAQYVQVIYTTKGALGMDTSAGHQNFWMNDGGSHPQPGCANVGSGDGMFTQLFESLSCSHTMATVYFIAAIDPSVNFMMKRCAYSWMYKIGMCALGKKDRLGINANRTPGDYYGNLVLPYPYAK